MRPRKTKAGGAVEENGLAVWIAQIIKPYVHDVLICDAHPNALIGRKPRKRDREDTYQLCRLLRLGELKRIYHADDDDRAIFKAAVQNYLVDAEKGEVLRSLLGKKNVRKWCLASGFAGDRA